MEFNRPENLEQARARYVELAHTQTFLEQQLLDIKRERFQLSSQIAYWGKREEDLNHGTGSAYDVPELHQTFKEKVLGTLLEGLDSISSRVTPG